jgi:hypothetical protein
VLAGALASARFVGHFVSESNVLGIAGAFSEALVNARAVTLGYFFWPQL